MTMDPRIEAVLVEIARTQCVPPGYTLRNVYDGCGRQPFPEESPWLVESNLWFHRATTKELACTAAWRRSDRRSSLPTTYCVVAAYSDMSAHREGHSDGWIALLYDPPTSCSPGAIAWRSEKCATTEDANEAAWDHYDLHDGAFMTGGDAVITGGVGEPPPDPPSKFSTGDPVRWAPNRDGKFLYGILERRRGRREIHALQWEIGSAIVMESEIELMSPRAWAEASGQSVVGWTVPRDEPMPQLPADCYWGVNGELVCTRAPHSPRYPLKIGRSTDGGAYFNADGWTTRIDMNVLRFFLDHVPVGK